MSGHSGGLGATSPPGSPAAKAFSFASESKERAYQMFREGPGKWIYTSLLEVKSRLKEIKTQAKVGGVCLRWRDGHCGWGR